MIYQRLLPKANIDIIHFWNQLRTTFWTKFGIQYAPSPAKLQIKMCLSFPFLTIPRNTSVSFPLPKFSFLFLLPNIGNAISHSCSHSQKLGMQFFIPIPVTKFGNGLSYSRSHSQNPKSHSRSPKCSPKCCQKMSKVGKMPKITISCISSWKLHKVAISCK